MRPDDPRSPLELLDALTMQEVEIADGFRHIEVYTMRGLLTLLWHGPVDASVRFPFQLGSSLVRMTYLARQVLAEAGLL